MKEINKRIVAAFIACLLLLSAQPGLFGSRVCAAELDVTAYYTRTAESLQKLKEKYAPTYDYEQAVFEEGKEPLITAETIRGGTLKAEVMEDTVRRINYYRELYGLQPVYAIHEEANYNAGMWAAALAAAGHIAHTAEDLVGKRDHPLLTTDFLEPLTYNRSPDPYLENIGMEATNIHPDFQAFLPRTVSAWMDDLYSNNSIGHRMTLLDPKVASWSAGFATDTLISEGQNLEAAYAVVRTHKTGGEQPENTTPPVAAYPTPGLFPSDAAVFREENRQQIETAQWHFEMNAGQKAVNPLVEILIDDEVVQAVKPTAYWDRVIYQYEPSATVLERIAEQNGAVMRGKPGAWYDVRISGFKDAAGLDVTYRYRTWFDYKAAGSEIVSTSETTASSPQATQITVETATTTAASSTAPLPAGIGSDRPTSSTRPSTVSSDVAVLQDDLSGVWVRGPGLTDLQLVVQSLVPTEQDQGRLADHEAIRSLYDIRLEKAGAAVQPLFPVEVGLPLPEGLDEQEIIIARLTENGREELAHKIEDYRIMFTVSHFSHYAVIVRGLTGVQTKVRPVESEPAECFRNRPRMIAC